MKKIYNQNIQLRTPVICLIIMIAAGSANLFGGDMYIAFLEYIVGIGIAAYLMMTGKKRAKDAQEFISALTEQSGNLANEALLRFPLPMVILAVDGTVIWYNNKAKDILEKSNLYGLSLPQLLPEMNWNEILKKDSVDIELEHNGKKYSILGNLIRKEDENGDANFSVILYFDDITELDSVRKKYSDEKVDVAIATIDNYDDVFQAMDDAKSRDSINKINAIVSKWVSDGSGILKKLESGKYQIFFEHKHLEEYIKNKFDILEKVRAVGDEIKEPITLSIGIGTGGALSENETFARNSVEMAWGRGGDQVVIKSDGDYSFYGGTAKDYEKSTRVKTRMFSTGLREMIHQADKVFIMGHASADYDSFGASVGLSRAAKLLAKQVFILIDPSPAIRPLYNEMEQISEYNGVVVSPSSAAELITKDSLIIIVDTHRPSMLPAPEILKVASKIVLIDHHRRSTEFVENVSLSYLEPYASSTCEMVTEIMQYIDSGKKMNKFEAKALYAGILTDTKNFLAKTGVRTFEAASYLKRYGVDTMEVKDLFNLNLDEYIKRMEIIKKAEIWNTDIAVSVCSESYNNMRVVSSQAADEMLNISGIKAAFVLYPLERDGGVAVSARSLGDVNVQLIMEKLGGGGHMTVAGCQIKGMSLAEGRDALKDVIRSYIDENKK